MAPVTFNVGECVVKRDAIDRDTEAWPLKENEDKVDFRGYLETNGTF